MNKILLRILNIFAPIINKSGADYGHIRTIVEYKLIMDGRNNALQLGQQSGSMEKAENRLIIMQFMYAIFGTAIGGMAIFAVESVFWGGFMILTYAMLMSFMLMLSEFAHNLLETNDNQILQPRPISGQTLYMARMVHIFLYLFRLNLSLVGIPFIMAFFGWGVAGAFTFLGLCVLSTVMVVAFTGMFYLSIMRITTPDRFRRIIGSVQVFLNIFFVGGFQIANQSINYFDISNINDYVNNWWHFLVPTAWLSGLLDLAVNRQPQTALFVLAAMAITVPMLCMWLTNRYLTPVFTKNIGELAVVSNPSKKADVVAQTQKSSHWLDRLAQLLNKNKAEEMAFLLTWKLTTRETKFKMRTFPIIGSLLPFLFIVFRKYDPNSQRYFLLLYAVPLLVFTAQFQARFSDSFKASWLFYGTPIEQPGLLLRGNSKALFIKYILPFQILITIVLTVAFGPKVLDDALLSFLIATAVLFAEPLQSTYHLPFSDDPSNQQKGTQTLLTIIMLFVIYGLAGIHWLIAKFTIGVWLGVLIAAFFVWRFYRNYDEIGWAKVKA